MQIVKTYRIMKTGKSARLAIDVLIVVIVVVIVFIGTLAQNIVPEPWTVERIFSKENVIETIIILVVASVIIIPVRMMILRRIKDKWHK
jgi:hypothetical protein